VHQEIIRIIASQRYGIGQEELIRRSKLLSSGGTAIKRLNELEAAGFIVSFIPYGKKEKGIYYRVIDEYTLFYLKWIETITKTPRKLVRAKNYWQAQMQSPSWRSWSGIAFEALCYKHIPQIMHALGISSSAIIGAWRYVASAKQDSPGAQIDLLFDRDDGVITICEIKLTDQPFKIDKEYYHRLMQKIEVFRRETGTNKQIVVAFITKSGLMKTIYSEELAPKVVVLSDFFKEV